MSASVISVSLPESLLKKLNKFCDMEERSKSFCVKKGLELFLLEEEQKVKYCKTVKSKKAAKHND